MKPRLIEANFINKIIENNNVKSNDSLNIGIKYIGECIVNVTTNYIDFFLLIISIILILYYRYKLNSSGKKKKPDEIIVNYYRNKNIFDDNSVTIHDNIKSDYDLDDEIIKKVKDKVSEVDDDLEPVNSTLYNDYAI
jgi:hypothetical protein